MSAGSGWFLRSRFIDAPFPPPMFAAFDESTGLDPGSIPLLLDFAADAALLAVLLRGAERTRPRTDSLH